MPESKVDYDEIKRKIRKLKKLEIKIRFAGICYEDSKQGLFVKPQSANLVWDEFFDLHDVCTGKAKYPISKLASMNKDEFKNVVNEYFFYIYYRFYNEARKCPLILKWRVTLLF